jgi:hypothetical protein
VSLERKRLGLGWRVLVLALVLLAAGHVVAAAFLLNRLRCASRTRAILESVRSCKRLRNSDLPRRKVGTARFQLFVLSYVSVPSEYYVLPPEDVIDVGRSCVLDAWGQPIRLVCPGPVHKNGWDLISCGPNGVYEEGGGDDIVVGEDLPGGIAAIQSTRR